MGMRRTKRGDIGAYIKAETVTRLARLVLGLAITLFVTLIVSAGVRYVDVHTSMWQPANYWPIYLSVFCPIVVGLLLLVTTAVWLFVRTARINACKKLMPAGRWVQSYGRGKRNS